MEPTILQRIGESLRGRHRDLAAWLGSASPQERSLRLGPHVEEMAAEQVAELASAVERAQNGKLGECVVCHEMVEEHLLEMDYSASMCLTHLTRDEQSRLEAGLELSQKVQKALLPGSIPVIAGWELAAFSQPASIVGGDYFDFLKFDDGAPAVLSPTSWERRDAGEHAYGEPPGHGADPGTGASHAGGSARTPQQALRPDHKSHEVRQRVPGPPRGEDGRDLLRKRRAQPAPGVAGGSWLTAYGLRPIT